MPFRGLMPAPQKLDQLKVEGSAWLESRKREQGDAEVEVLGRADYLRAEAGRDGRARLRAVPEARDQRADVLRLEEEVRRDGRGGGPPREPARGRKPPVSRAERT